MESWIDTVPLAAGWNEWRVTLAVVATSLVAVWWPLVRGALLCWRARVATRVPRPVAGGDDAAPTNAPASVAETLRAVLDGAAAELSPQEPRALVRDAAKQLVVEEYETHFAQPISMYANILPPIGFIGTTCGLAILLLSMRTPHGVLQMGALALALSSTIFALIGYAILESVKIHLYGRLARSLDAGLAGGDQPIGGA